MKKLSGTIIAISLFSTACASSNTPKEMGETCERGHTIFYAKMTKSGAEEKLCKVSNTEHYFYTKSATDIREVGVKALSVTPRRTEGTVGYTSGYNVSLSMGDTVELLALYKTKDNTKPVAGFLIFNDEVVELDAPSIRHVEAVQ